MGDKNPVTRQRGDQRLATSMNAFADFFPGLAAGGGQARSPLPALGNCRPRPADYGPCFQPRLPPCRIFDRHAAQASRRVARNAALLGVF